MVVAMSPTFACNHHHSVLVATAANVPLVRPRDNTLLQGPIVFFLEPGLLFSIVTLALHLPVFFFALLLRLLLRW
jgi:hypothetical protein